MMRRVDTYWIYRESGRVRTRYEKSVEEHLGVTNQNGKTRVGLVGSRRYTGTLSIVISVEVMSGLYISQ